MKKTVLAILLSLLIPFSLISCKESSENGKSKENTANSSSVNNNVKDAEKEEKANIYYYDAVADKIVYINTTIKVKDDDAVTSLIDELKKSPNSDISSSLSSEIKLISSNLDTEKSTITLDFSSNFVNAQNLGSGAESSTLTAICNTFGNYFNIENVIITLEEKPYSSGHILMDEGEAFKVNLNDAIELK